MASRLAKIILHLCGALALHIFPFLIGNGHKIFAGKKQMKQNAEAKSISFY